MKSRFADRQLLERAFRAVQLMRWAGWMTVCSVQGDMTVDATWTEHGALKVTLLKHYALRFGLNLDDDAVLAFNEICAGKRPAPHALALFDGWPHIARFWQTTVHGLGVTKPTELIGIVYIACRCAPDRPEMRISV